MYRRTLLQGIALLSWLGTPATAAPLRRVRPGDPGWPSAASWQKLNREVGGRLIQVRSPLAVCRQAPGSTACAGIFHELKNPYFIGDSAGLTETSGWVDAWTSTPSAYAVAAHTTADVVAAVNFARERNLRLVVKGGGHSYQGTSDAPDSLLVWTRNMRAIAVHDAFTAQGCTGPAQPAVTIEAGAIWREAYEAVMAEAGRYVQGGGCMDVGVAGLIQSGGFGSFSKRFGMAAAALLEAEIVTADGKVRIVNACTNPELFWGLKGGGGGSLGVVTRVTLRTRELPEFLGKISGKVRATSDAAFQRLIGRFVGFYAESLFNPHWGEQITLREDNSMELSMQFQGLDQAQAKAVWQPFLDWMATSPQDFSVETPIVVTALSGRQVFDPAYMLKNYPGFVRVDDRAGAPPDNIFWAGDYGQVGFFLHGYDSTWLPAMLLDRGQQQKLVDALFQATRHWWVGLHFNKGLAGAPAEEVSAAKNTAMNPAVLDAFVLVIIAGGEQPAFPGLAGHEPDLTTARSNATKIGQAMDEIVKLVADRGAYVSEGNFFDPAWQHSFWGPNYPRLQAVKRKYDPAGLFFVHHGVGSEAWSADGFTRTG